MSLALGPIVHSISSVHHQALIDCYHEHVNKSESRVISTAT